jgi:hypothetical protein
MELVEQLDGVDLLEEHAKSVLLLESDESRRILAVYQRVAVDLRKKLSRLPADSFTAQRARSVLIQLEGAILALQSRLNILVLDGALKMRQRGLTDTIKEFNKMQSQFAGTGQPIDMGVIQEATDASGRLFNQYEASIATYSDTVRQSLAQGLQDMIVGGAGPEEIVTRMSSFFGMEEWRLRRIVRTELQGVYAAAKLDSLGAVARRYAPDMMKTLYQPMDARTSKDSLHAIEVQNRGVQPWEAQGDDALEALVVPVNVNFRYVWNGRQRRFMHPPDRPNDRSILIPWRPSWES